MRGRNEAGVRPCALLCDAYCRFFREMAPVRRAGRPRTWDSLAGCAYTAADLPPGRLTAFATCIFRFVPSMRCICESAKKNSKRTQDCTKEAANIHLEVFLTPQESAVTSAIVSKNRQYSSGHYSREPQQQRRLRTHQQHQLGSR